jgi:hypothetical protein
MGNIYSSAHHPVIYLGPHENHQSERRDDTLSNSLICPSDKDIVEVLASLWLRRVWVFQEVVPSKNLWVQCGRCRSS